MIIKAAMFWSIILRTGLESWFLGNGLALFTLLRVFRKPAEPGGRRRMRGYFLKPGDDKQEGT
jgi:hypothetical protein